MRWTVIFSIQVLSDFSFARSDSWVAGSGMITSLGFITCEKDNIGVPRLKHCNGACWRASVDMENMFPTSCVSTLSVPPWDVRLPTALPLQWGFWYLGTRYNHSRRIRGSHLIYAVHSALNATSGIAVQHAALIRSIHPSCYLPALRLLGKMLSVICPNLYWLLHPES